MGDFFAFEAGLRDGVYVTAGDIDGDGLADPTFGAGNGGSPRVLGISATALLADGPTAAIAAPLTNFFASNPNERTGVRVTAKDLDGDGLSDLVTGSGGVRPLVRAYAGADMKSPGQPSALFELDAAPSLMGGVFVG